MISRLLGMEIAYNLHASNRGLEREVDISLVRNIIDDPETECDIQCNGRLKFVNRGTVIIGEVRRSCLWIITVFLTGRKEKA